MNEIQTAIAGAVEEQSATAKEMARSMESATAGSQEIAQAISAVAQAAETNMAGATRVREASARIDAVAAVLAQRTGSFRV